MSTNARDCPYSALKKISEHSVVARSASLVSREDKSRKGPARVREHERQEEQNAGICISEIIICSNSIELN